MRIFAGCTLPQRLAQNTFLYARATVDDSGDLPEVKLQHALAHLLLKAGLKVVDFSDGFESATFLVDCNLLTFNLSGIQGSGGDVPIDLDVDYTGHLNLDLLLPIYAGPEKDYQHALSITVCSEYPRSVQQPSHAYQGGVIYEVAADNSRWRAVRLTGGEEPEDPGPEEPEPGEEGFEGE